MSIRPWREVAQPHKDVLEGTFKQSEFAADISQVHSGTAPAEYQDAEKFFQRTYITEGMRLLLISVAERLSGRGGDPVVQLQTAFGGGKTHTLLAVYHLASRECSTDKLTGIPPILDAAGASSLPQARVAVIDGIKLSPSQPRDYDGITVNTLWGELAAQLGGADGFAMVADSDRDGTSPGKEVLTRLIAKAAPCVILIDELVAYIRQFEMGKNYKGGSYDSNITFVQALSEAMKSVPNAILLASLPESELEVGGAVGQQALTALEKYFGRVENVWKPVGSEEAFEIVRRRLFETISDTDQVQATARAFAKLYRDNAAKFPSETQEARYEERIAQSYPIHPEVFDRLYEDWSTLDKFQRTRGVLQYMAIVIHRLWNDNDKDPMILPGSLPLHDGNVRNKSVHYLPNGWEPVIEREIDGRKSEALEIDGHDTRFGSIQAARRVARTIFLGSAPSNAGQSVRGIRVERILLGSALPEQAVGTYEDVIKRLRDKLHYLYGEQDSYWFDTRPNLRREMESRKTNVKDAEALLPLLRERVRGVFGGQHFFDGIHVFTPSGDIPDETGTGPRLVVLPPNAAYQKQNENVAIQPATELLEKRGDAPRLKQNRLIFVAADADSVSRLKDAARTYLAWKSIVEDVRDRRMDLGTYQADQAKRNMDNADESLRYMVRETYRWLMVPGQEMQRGRLVTRWEAVSVSSSAPKLVEAIQNKLVEEEWVIQTWSPVHLKRILDQWYFKEGVSEVSVLKLWQDCCQYLYLPRLLSPEVLKQAITSGVASRDYFGYADTVDDDGYKGFVFGGNALVSLDAYGVIVRLETAQSVQEARDRAATPPDGAAQPGPDGQPAALWPAPDGSKAATQGGTPEQASPAPAMPRKFYASTDLDPVTATMDFSKLVDEVVQHFTARLGVEVSINIEINASHPDGFDQNLQRTVRENCAVLKFKNADFG